MKLKSLFIPDEQDDQWISIADMMAGLMVVFLFIAIINLKSQYDKIKNFEILQDNIYISDLYKYVGQDEIFFNRSQYLNDFLDDIFKYKCKYILNLTSSIRFIKQMNIENILKANNFLKDLDIFSLDVDGIDYWILKVLPEKIS